MDELKPCPFCGAEMIANTNTKDIYVRRYGPHYMHPESPYCVLGHFEISPSEIAAWNRRTLSPSASDQDAERAALLGALGVKGRRIDGDQPLPDLIRQLHRDGLGSDEIAATLTRLGRDSEADAAGISIRAVIQESAAGVGGNDGR